MDAGAAVTDLRSGDERWAVIEAGGGGGAAGALRDVLVDLAVDVGTGSEALYRGDDHPRVQLLDALPGEAHAIERARREVLVDLAVDVGTGSEALYRGDDHPRVQLLDALPGEAHAIERARREV